MTIDQFFEAIAKIAGVLFVVTSMLAMGLSLTIPMIAGPLRNVRLVVLALVANFVLVPALAYLIVTVIPIDEALRTGLIVLATAAGAPFLPKLVQGANGDVAFGVGLMVLLMVVTIGYMPLVLPLLLPGVSVDAASIAKSLVVLMLVPLGWPCSFERTCRRSRRNGSLLWPGSPASRSWSCSSWGWGSTSRGSWISSALAGSWHCCSSLLVHW